jgi:hypothetical protein
VVREYGEELGVAGNTQVVFAERMQPSDSD